MYYSYVGILVIRVFIFWVVLDKFEYKIFLIVLRFMVMNFNFLVLGLCKLCYLLLYNVILCS